MLLDEQAAIWWQGAKASFMEWSSRHAYGKNKSAPKIFRVLFSRVQANKKSTDVFVSKCRSVLSYLPNQHILHYLHKLDMIYTAHRFCNLRFINWEGPIYWILFSENYYLVKLVMNILPIRTVTSDLGALSVIILDIATQNVASSQQLIT